MHAILQNRGDAAVISLCGHFDFKRCSDVPLRSTGVRSIEVNLEGVEYLDSSALGMLLLHDKVTGRGNNVSLSNCQGVVKEILDIANFGVIFNMH